MATTLASGIWQGDIIIRTAVIKALEEIRNTPTLIDDALASLPQDELTAGRYGEKTIQECKDWFLKTKVPIKLGLSLAQLKSPQICIELNDGSEAEATLGDVNYEPSEDQPHYDNPEEARQLASVHERQSFNIIVMVQGEPELMLFLWSLTLFGLLRNKETLLDARGFSRLTWSTGVAGMLDPAVVAKENFFTRAIRLNGYARHCWPPAITPVGQPQGYIEDVPVSINPTEADLTVAPFDPNDNAWSA